MHGSGRVDEAGEKPTADHQQVSPIWRSLLTNTESGLKVQLTSFVSEKWHAMQGHVETVGVHPGRRSHSQSSMANVSPLSRKHNSGMPELGPYLAPLLNSRRWHTARRRTSEHFSRLMHEPTSARKEYLYTRRCTIRRHITRAEIWGELVNWRLDRQSNGSPVQAMMNNTWGKMVKLNRKSHGIPLHYFGQGEIFRTRRLRYKSWHSNFEGRVTCIYLRRVRG
jgi:hypothetical protein